MLYDMLKLAVQGYEKLEVEKIAKKEELDRLA